MNDFTKILRGVIDSAPFDGNQRTLAQHAGCDQALLSRVLSGDREPTPEFVGRLCGTLSADHAAELLKAYLNGVVESVATTKRKAGSKGSWTPALSQVNVSVNCSPRRKSA